MTTAPWVLMTQQPFGAHCTRCGAAWIVGLPSSVEAVLAAVKAFAGDPRECPETGAEIPPARQEPML